MADHPPSPRGGSPILPTPTSGDGLHNGPSNLGEQHPLLRLFKLSVESDQRAKYQTFLLFYKMTIQVIVTGLLWGAIYQLLELAEEHGVLNNQKRYAFNVGITGLPLLLGIQILVSNPNLPACRGCRANGMTCRALLKKWPVG